MSKAKVTFLIIALLLIIGGGAIFGVCYARGARFDDNIQFETKTIELEEDFNKINVDLYITSFEIVKSDTNKVETTESEKMHHEVKVVNGELKITFVDESKWYEKFLIFGNKYKVKLFLANDNYESIVFKNYTGACNITDVFTFNEIILDNTTGSIKAAGLNGTNARVKTDTGRIELNNLNITNNLNVSSATGSIVLNNTTCNNLTINNSTGSEALTNVIASNNIVIKSSTGSVNFNGIDAANINIESSTGSIRGSVLTEKVFIASSSTGHVNVPSTSNGGRCELKTSTGSITVTIKE